MPWKWGDWLLAGSAAAAAGGGIYLGARAMQAHPGAGGKISTGSSTPPAGNAHSKTGTGGPGPNSANLPAGLPPNPTANQRVTLNGQCWQYMPAIPPASAAEQSQLRADWQANISAAQSRGLSLATAYAIYGSPAALSAALAARAVGLPARWNRCVVAIPAGPQTG